MSRKPTIEDYGIPSYDTVVVTGPRFWDDLPFEDKRDRLELVQNALLTERAAYGEFTLVHGKAKGLDQMSGNLWEIHRGEVIEVPYFGWLRGGGGPARNKFMLVEYKPRIVHAFHDKPYRELPQPGSGTADCVRQALELGIKVMFHSWNLRGSLLIPNQRTLV